MNIIKTRGCASDRSHCEYCGQGYLERKINEPDLLECSMCRSIYNRKLEGEELNNFWNEAYDNDSPDFEDFLHEPMNDNN